MQPHGAFPLEVRFCTGGASHSLTLLFPTVRQMNNVIAASRGGDKLTRGVGGDAQKVRKDHSTTRWQAAMEASKMDFFLEFRIFR